MNSLSTVILTNLLQINTTAKVKGKSPNNNNNHWRFSAIQIENIKQGSLNSAPLRILRSLQIVITEMNMPDNRNENASSLFPDLLVIWPGDSSVAFKRETISSAKQNLSFLSEKEEQKKNSESLKQVNSLFPALLFCWTADCSGSSNRDKQISRKSETNQEQFQSSLFQSKGVKTFSC